MLISMVLPCNPVLVIGGPDRGTEARYRTYGQTFQCLETAVAASSSAPAAEGGDVSGGPNSSTPDMPSTVDRAE
jgi:hypothetical protein